MSFDNIATGDLGRDLRAKEPKPRGWFRRNWLWFVPTLFLATAVMCCGCPTAIIFGVVGLFRNSEPYLLTMQKVQADPQVKEALGEPIKDMSWIPAGEISTKNGAGNAELRWDLAGPKGKGKVYVKARMTEEKWEIVIIEVSLPGGKKVLLHDESAGGNDAPAFTPQGAAEHEKTQEPALPSSPDLNISLPEESEQKK